MSDQEQLLEVDKGALTDYLRAVQKHAQLQILAAQIPARLAEAEAEVATAAERAGLRKPKSIRVSRTASAAASSNAEALLPHLPGTAAEIAKRAGGRPHNVGRALASAARRGEVEMVHQEQGPPIYRLPQETA